MIDSAHYRFRQQRSFDYLSEHDLEVGVIVDVEGLRNRSLRYLCGHPEDALLFLFAAGRSLLVPWDVPLAHSLATADEMIPFQTYGRSIFSCIKTILEERKIKRAEVSAILPYPLVQTLKESLAGDVVRCHEGGIDETIDVLRIIKDSEEIKAIRRACRITDSLIEAVPGLFAARKEVTEVELALFLEGEARRRGAEGMGFETLAASTRRSYAIHCFPRFTAGPIGNQGLSILDFGVRFDGYTSDVTLTLARLPLKEKQEAMVEAVEQAYELARNLCTPGADPVVVGDRVQEYFQDRGFRMPHALGHGIGLDAHEAPSFRRSSSTGVRENRRIFQPGMVFTLEPGLYDPNQGGVRLENDFLCIDGGTEVLTSARILYL
ncbi:MAG: aminopeptidase P family protein [Spirochaetaceae bacterium]|nr:MAG: aminopeptidase P family protein [Spirochaetaceae bacterium]